MTMPRFSQAIFEDNFLKERELFEIIRSRKVYQVQLELMRNHRNQIRSIETEKKSYFSGHENKRAIFLKKMAEQVRQRNEIKTDSGTMGKDMPEVLLKMSKVYLATDIKPLTDNGICKRRATMAAPDHFPDTESARISKNQILKIKLSPHLVESYSTLGSVEYHEAAKPFKQPGNKTKMEVKIKKRYGAVKEMCDYKFETQVSKRFPKRGMKGLNGKLQIF